MYNIIPNKYFTGIILRILNCLIVILKTNNNGLYFVNLNIILYLNIKICHKTK